MNQILDYFLYLLKVILFVICFFAGWAVYNQITAKKIQREEIKHVKCWLQGNEIFNKKIKYGDYYIEGNVIKIKNTIRLVFDKCEEN